MAYSTQRATSDGTLQTLLLSIKFFDKAEITVFLNDVPQVSGTGYTWATATSIQFPAPLSSGTAVLVKRTTALDAPRHLFTQGAQFKSETLDENSTQMLRIAQEAVEGSGLGEVFNDLDMHGYRPINLGTAVNPGDAVSLGQYQADANGAYGSKVAAASSAAAAAASATTATEQAVLAEAAKQSASGSASASSILAQAASTSATSASTSASTATTQATLAASAYDAFDDRYLGSKTANPTLDNDDAALLTGALYWNSTSAEMRVWTGTVWVATYLPAAAYPLKSSNLSDMPDAAACRLNLGLTYGPMFRVYRRTGIAVGASGLVRVGFGGIAPTYDTASGWNAALHRYTPPVAGYYAVTGAIGGEGMLSGGHVFPWISLNGVLYSSGNGASAAAATAFWGVTVSTVCYCNGTTDYLELWSVASGPGTADLGELTISYLRP